MILRAVSAIGLSLLNFRFFAANSTDKQLRTYYKMAASKPISRFVSTPKKPLPTKPILKDLTIRSGLFPSRQLTLSSIV